MPFPIVRSRPFQALFSLLRFLRLRPHPPHPMRLPTELLELVIDQASDDPATLRSLSVTCRAFLPRSRSYLFSGICIRTVEQMESSSDFLDKHTWLPPLVHRVTLAYESAESKSWPNARVVDIVPVHLLTRLPNLRVWKTGPVVVNNTAHQASLSLHRYTLSLYRSTSTCIHRLELRTVHFDCLADFIGLISSFNSIHTLTCYNIDFRRDEEFNASLYVGRTGRLSCPLQISTLEVII